MKKVLIIIVYLFCMLVGSILIALSIPMLFLFVKLFIEKPFYNYNLLLVIFTIIILIIGLYIFRNSFYLLRSRPNINIKDLLQYVTIGIFIIAPSTYHLVSGKEILFKNNPILLLYFIILLYLFYKIVLWFLKKYSNNINKLTH